VRGGEREMEEEDVTLVEEKEEMNSALVEREPCNQYSCISE